MILNADNNPSAILIPEISQNPIQIESTEDTSQAVAQYTRTSHWQTVEQTNHLQNKTELTDTSSTGEKLISEACTHWTCLSNQLSSLDILKFYS